MDDEAVETVSDLSKSVTLNVINNLQELSIESAKASTRSATGALLASVVLCALSANQVTFEPHFALLGTNLVASVYVVLLSGAWFAVFATIRALEYALHADKLAAKIRDLYASVGVVDGELLHEHHSFLEYPTFANLLVRERRYKSRFSTGFLIVILLTFLLLPLAAIACVHLRLRGVYGHTLWLLADFLVSAFLLLSYWSSLLLESIVKAATRSRDT